ncbi:MAG: aspartyl protease family protein [Pirellulaceae bacterium]|nr:aspartyl protease family protein [Pirellulaceae bacterium]
MGRLIASVTIVNALDESKRLRCDALVDTGASHMVLPSAWKERLGQLKSIETLELETATQTIVEGEVVGPVKIQIEGFRPVFSEVLFVDVQPADEIYEPLLGYIPLEHSQAAVDVLGHRLLHAKHMDLK